MSIREATSSICHTFPTLLHMFCICSHCLLTCLSYFPHPCLCCTFRDISSVISSKSSFLFLAIFTLSIFYFSNYIFNFQELCLFLQLPLHVSDPLKFSSAFHHYLFLPLFILVLLFHADGFFKIPVILRKIHLRVKEIPRYIEG